MMYLRRKWVVTLVALAGLVVVPLSLRYHQAHLASKQLKEIQLLGEPITFAEILEEYEKPPHDATRLWMEGFSLLAAVGEEDMETLSRLPFVGFADTPARDCWENIELAERYVEQRAEADARLHAAADMGGEARFAVDPASGFSGFLHPEGLLDAHDLLRLETGTYMGIERTLRGVPLRSEHA